MKECIEKENVSVCKWEECVKVEFEEKRIYNGVGKRLCSWWKEGLCVVKKDMWKEEGERLGFWVWFGKVIELLKEKCKVVE